MIFQTDSNGSLSENASEGNLDGGTGFCRHFAFEYNEQLDEKAAKALGTVGVDTAEWDLVTMTEWFSGATPRGGVIDTKINLDNGGASDDFVNNINLSLGATV